MPVLKESILFDVIDSKMIVDMKMLQLVPCEQS